MLALPPLAVLAAFALPTLQRSTAAAIDWFSVFFFTHRACDRIWVIYVAMQTGVPAQPAANVAQARRPASCRSFSLLALLLARGRHARLAVAGALAHRPPPPSALEEPGAAGRRRQRLCWLLRDDAAAAAARLRAQLSRAWCSASRAQVPRERLHRGAGHAARAGRRARVPRRLSRRRAARRANAGRCDVPDAAARAAQAAAPPPAGSWSRSERRLAATTRSTDIYRRVAAG